jgi:hypothetical protein
MDTYGAVANMVQEAERHADDLSKDRICAVEYYQGVMNDTPSDAGRSKLTTREVRAAIRKVLPSVVRTILGNDEVVEYEPVGPEDEAGAAQASDYMNYVVLDESGARKTIQDAVHDALLLRNGILKWWWDEKQVPKVSRHTGLTEDQLMSLAADDDVEVMETSQYSETIQTEAGIEEIALFDVKLKRLEVKGMARTATVPRERFLIHPDAISLSDSLLTGEKVEDMRRSDLIAMGYDRELVMSLPIGDEDDYEETVRRDVAIDHDESTKSNEKITYYDLYVRVDLDGDGISELRHMCFAGGLKEEHLLKNDDADEVQYCDITALNQPHQWEGASLYDDLKDVQQVNTVLLRQTADNLYWQNNPQPTMQSGAVMNPEAVYNPEFGLPIEVARGVDVRQALSFMQVPFVAKDSFGMMEFMRAEAQERTGVSDASAGLAPDALQNMTAKASAMIEQAGIGQTELMVSNLAEGLKVFFGGLLRLIIRHQDVERIARLRGEWVSFDPRHWNADMDVTINIGLGAGTRERDMLMMQQVIGLQEKLIAGFGPDNPFVKPDNLYNAITKLAEAAGLRSVRTYFSEPDPEEVEAKLEAMKNQPNPEMEKIAAQKEVELAKAQSAQAKEKAQMDADLQVEDARLQSDLIKQDKEIAAQDRRQSRELDWEREKFYAERGVVRVA